MIHYHGEITSTSDVSYDIWKGRHAFISFARPNVVNTPAEVCQSFAFDNGAFSAWKTGDTIDRFGYYQWVEKWHRHPGFDWAVIPDVIDGTEKENDDYVKDWPLPRDTGVPVWHMHESTMRLMDLSSRWRRIALGSSGEYAVVGNDKWWDRMAEAMEVVTAPNTGEALVKLHGLRMLNPDVYRYLPLASADSTNVGQNIGIDGRWKGPYEPPNKKVRGLVLAERAEAFQSANHWAGRPKQEELFKYTPPPGPHQNKVEGSA